MVISKTHLLRKFDQTPPAIVALLIQFASLGIIAITLFFLWKVDGFKLTLSAVVLLQAAITLSMTRCFNLAWWWCVIQPLFPLAIMLMLTLTLPSFVYFLIFSFLLVFYWSTFRTQVPYFPSTKNVWATVDQLLPENRPITFVDIGSGLGGLVLYLAKRHPESRFLGVEIAPLPWLLSYLRTLGRSKSGRSNTAQFMRSNYEDMDFSQMDVVFAFLSPAAMPELWVKAKREMQPGSLLISLEFPILEEEADLCICPENKGANIYLWYL